MLADLPQAEVTTPPGTPSSAWLDGAPGWGLLAGMAGLDLFISYSGKDRQWAVWLDFVLREAGHHTTVQAYDFLPGKSFVEAIDQALKTNNFVACLLSPAYLASRWCTEEWPDRRATRTVCPS